MIINLDENTYFDSGLALSNKGAVTKALQFFGKCNSYEAWLNRVIILLLRGDYSIANYVLRSNIAKFDRYNWRSDLARHIAKFDEDALEVVPYLKRVWQYARKTNCDDSKIVTFDQINNDIDEEDFDDTGIDLADLEEVLDDSRMFDYSSLEYQQYLKFKIFLLHGQGKKTEAAQLTEQLLAMPTNHVDILEWKVFMLVNLKRYDQAMEIAEKIYCEDIHCVNLALVVEALVCGCGSKDKVLYCLEKLLSHTTRLSTDTVEELLHIATNYLGNTTLASRYADFVVSEYQFFPINCLRSCIWIYLNNCQDDKAKQCCAMILSIIPEDIMATAIIESLPLLDSNRAIFAYQIPTNIRTYVLHPAVERHMINYLRDNIDNVTQRYCLYLLAICSHNRTINKKHESAKKENEVLKSIINNCVIDKDSNVFADMVCKCMIHNYASLDIIALLVARCVREDIHIVGNVNLSNGYYTFDSAIIDKGDDDYIMTQCLIAMATKCTKTSLAKYTALANNCGDDVFSNVLSVLLDMKVGTRFFKRYREDLLDIIQLNDCN